MDNFLNLCRWVQPRIGYSGQLDSVTTATADLAKIVSHVREADERLMSLYQDWELLKKELPLELQTDPVQAVYDPPEDLGNYRHIPWPATVDGHLSTLHVVTRQGPAYLMHETTPAGRPSVVILNPDRTMRFWPPPAVASTVTVLYHRLPPALTLDADVPLIPRRFRYAIGWEAVRTLAEVESDTPLMQYATLESNKWLSQLIADQLPGHKELHYGGSEALSAMVVPE